MGLFPKFIATTDNVIILQIDNTQIMKFFIKFVKIKTHPIHYYYSYIVHFRRYVILTFINLLINP